MKNRITLLIIVSVIALLALSAIQAHLIFNTYELERDSFVRETDEALTDIDNRGALDSLYAAWGSELMVHISDYKNDRITKTDVLDRMFAKADSISALYNAHYLSEVNKLDLDYDVAFKKKLVRVVTFDGSVNDTIFPQSHTRNTAIFGLDFAEEDANVINRNTWFTEHEYISLAAGSISSRSYEIEIRSENLALVKDWRRIVISRMATLLVLSVLLFLFVIGLLFYSIRKLISQKRIADIKTDFINNITHELKTPLATMSIATKSLRDSGVRSSEEAYLNTLNIVDRQNERLQKLIDQVMSNSLSSSDIVLHREQVIDNRFFLELIADFKLSTQSEGLVVKNEVLEAEVILRIDTFHFTTALLNILENAVKYGNKDTEIRIRTELKNGEYLIYISDNGIGVSEHDQQHLFEKFYRVSEGDKHDVKGLGLGLYLVDQILRAHKGSISVRSELRKGTTFMIKIPLN